MSASGCVFRFWEYKLPFLKEDEVNRNLLMQLLLNEFTCADEMTNSPVGGLRVASSFLWTHLLIIETYLNNAGVTFLPT